MSTDVQAAAGSVPAGGKTPESCVMVIFGASGDLTERKLIPALYKLALEQRLPERFAVIGYARSEMSHEAFRQKMGDAVSELLKGKCHNLSVTQVPQRARCRPCAVSAGFSFTASNREGAHPGGFE